MFSILIYYYFNLSDAENYANCFSQKEFENYFRVFLNLREIILDRGIQCPRLDTSQISRITCHFLASRNSKSSKLHQFQFLFRVFIK